MNVKSIFTIFYDISAYQRLPALHRGHQVLQPQRKHGSHRRENADAQRLQNRRGIHDQVRDRQDGRAVFLQFGLVHRQSHPRHRRLRPK